MAKAKTAAEKKKPKAPAKPKATKSSTKKVSAEPQPQGVVKQVALEDLVLDADTQVRVHIDESTVEEYAESLRSGAELPPLDGVELKSGKVVLYDGFHRACAYQDVGVSHAMVRVVPGTVEDAKWLSTSANRTHGLKRSNADKRRAVEVALSLRPELADRLIAEHCGVSHTFVAAVRKQLATVATSGDDQVATVATSDGDQVATVATSGDDQVATVATSGGEGVPVPGEDQPTVSTDPQPDSSSPKRVGKDGKTYPSQRTAPTASDKNSKGVDWRRVEELRCELSKTLDAVGQTPQVEKVQRLLAEAGAGIEAVKRAKAEPTGHKDAWEIPVQPHAEQAFAALPRFAELERLLKQAQRLFHELAMEPGGKFLTLPEVASYRRGRKNEDGTYADRFVHEGIDQALKQVHHAAPAHTVCPWRYAEAPHPDDCRTCLGLDWTPSLSHRAIPESVVAKVKSELGAGAA